MEMWKFEGMLGYVRMSKFSSRSFGAHSGLTQPFRSMSMMSMTLVTANL